MPMCASACAATTTPPTSRAGRRTIPPMPRTWCFSWSTWTTSRTSTTATATPPATPCWCRCRSACEVFRESDYLVRWGGEEFLVLARATRRDEARVVAERIRRAVADREFLLPDGERLRKTCSIGFACFPFVPDAPRLLSWSEVVELADQALYLAKHN